MSNFVNQAVKFQTTSGSVICIVAICKLKLVIEKLSENNSYLSKQIVYLAEFNINTLFGLCIYNSTFKVIKYKKQLQQVMLSI